jgi:ATP-dependent DNA ligase
MIISASPSRREEASTIGPRYTHFALFFPTHHEKDQQTQQPRSDPNDGASLKGAEGAVALCAFDLIELDGEDLRRESIETRKSTLKSLLRGKYAGIAFNAHFIADGGIVYRQACALGCEGIVSKRLGSPYRSGRADCWVKVKNPAAPAVTREAEEEWN